MRALFLLFVAVPLLELYLLISVGQWLGAWTTVGLVMITGALGASLARAEGARMLRGWQGSLSAGRVPEDGVIDGGLLLVGAVLLVTPGVLTDAVGLSLLLPPSRRLWARLVRSRLSRAIENGRVQVIRSHPGVGGFGPGFDPSPPQTVIDVEAEVVEQVPRSRRQQP